MDYFIERFYYHLEAQSIDDAVVLALQEAEATNLDEDQITEVIDKLVKANVKMFADHYTDYEKLFEFENPYAVLESYCQSNQISEDLANAMAITRRVNYA